jgi:hypothetical protein
VPVARLEDPTALTSTLCRRCAGPTQDEQCP